MKRRAFLKSILAAGASVAIAPKLLQSSTDTVAPLCKVPEAEDVKVFVGGKEIKGFPYPPQHVNCRCHYKVPVGYVTAFSANEVNPFEHNFISIKYKIYAGNGVWLNANGAHVSSTVFPELYNVLSTEGSERIGMFKLPDFRGFISRREVLL